jgi:hypothetical protein
VPASLRYLPTPKEFGQSVHSTTSYILVHYLNYNPAFEKFTHMKRLHTPCSCSRPLPLPAGFHNNFHIHVIISTSSKRPSQSSRLNSTGTMSQQGGQEDEHDPSALHNSGNDLTREENLQVTPKPNEDLTVKVIDEILMGRQIKMPGSQSRTAHPEPASPEVMEREKINTPPTNNPPTNSLPTNTLQQSEGQKHNMLPWPGHIMPETPSSSLFDVESSNQRPADQARPTEPPDALASALSRMTLNRHQANWNAVSFTSSTSFNAGDFNPEDSFHHRGRSSQLVPVYKTSEFQAKVGYKVFHCMKPLNSNYLFCRV